MDGPIFQTDRVLTVEFKTDRNSQERLELAFHRLETVESDLNPTKSHLELDLDDRVATPHSTSEIHG